MNLKGLFSFGTLQLVLTHFCSFFSEFLGVLGLGFGIGFGFSELLKSNQNDVILQRLDDLEYCQSQNIDQFTQISEALKTLGTKINELNTKLEDATLENFYLSDGIMVAMEADALTGMRNLFILSVYKQYSYMCLSQCENITIFSITHILHKIKVGDF